MSFKIFRIITQRDEEQGAGLQRGEVSVLLGGCGEEEDKGGGGGHKLRRGSEAERRIQGLALKLDYQEILKVSSNKGPLYVDAENWQIVPDMSVGFLLQDSSSNNVMGLWKVPEMGQRQASLLRYKEKRRNRLHSKKIHYQVRKLNADKRP